ncbi:hypothetical protein PFISCL1PPCAC_12622, partial [Pristionchus fissidentatus]
ADDYSMEAEREKCNRRKRRDRSSSVADDYSMDPEREKNNRRDSTASHESADCRLQHLIEIDEETEKTESDVMIISSPTCSPRKRLSFRHSRTSAAQHARTARAASPPGYSRPEEAFDTERAPREISLWNRTRKDDRRVCVSGMIPSAIVIVVDNEIFKQIKRDVWAALMSLADERKDEEKKRMIMVIHKEFDPDSGENCTSLRQLRSVDPSLIYVTDHKGEKMSDDVVDCCLAVRRMAGNEKADMIYLTPNIDSHDVRNQKLNSIGFKVLNGCGAKGHFEAMDLDEQLNEGGYDY